MREIPQPDPNTTPRLLARLRDLSAHDWRELAARLDSLRGDQVTSVWRRAQRRRYWLAPVFGTPSGATQALFAASELRDLVAASCPGDRVLLEMVLLSAQLVAYRASVADAAVREHYAFLEPIFPFADLTAA